MPLSVKKKGGKYVVTDPAGKEFGTHDTKKKAVDQIAAIESSKRRKKAMNDATNGVKLVAAKRVRLSAGELGTSHGAEETAAPPIAIISDGTPEGTVLLLHGQPVATERISMYCSKSKDYPYCDLSVTVKESDDNGMVIEKTMTLRKEPPADDKPCAASRGRVICDSAHPNVIDEQDHFPINDENQARSALARVNQLDAAPKWWNSTLDHLKAAVASAVLNSYPTLNVSE